jgi:phage-related protein
MVITALGSGHTLPPMLRDPNIYRVFSFFDEGSLVVLINGFIKKTQKTPRSEIELAERIKKQYFDEKDI